jgi:phenylacetate-CoA ligase
MGEAEVMEKLNKQLAIDYELPIYRKKFDAAGITPADIKSPEDLRKIPLLTTEDIVADFEEHPPYGSLYRKDVTAFYLTPAPEIGLMPAYFTAKDQKIMAQALAGAMKRMGMTSDDIVQVAVGYTPFFIGCCFTLGIQELGAKFIPLGPGNTEQQANIMNRCKVTALVAAPTFALRIAEAGGKGIKFFISVLEPFSSIEGLREKVIDAFGGELVTSDLYALGHVGFVAQECKHLTGLHILDDWVWAEIVDPDTGAPLPYGDRGELVLTSVDREAMPFLRFRTGDLSVLTRSKCQCGKEFTLPEGVFGIIGEMRKVKGVKFYPSQIALVAAGIPGLSRDYQAVISTVDGKDHLKITVKGDPKSDKEMVKEKIKQAILFTPDEVEIAEELTEKGVVDKRF